MPITSSAQKALRQSIRHRATNIKRKRSLNEAIKAFRKTKTKENLSKVYQSLDKAAKVKLIKKNTASRLKSRLTKLLQNQASRT